MLGPTASEKASKHLVTSGWLRNNTVVSIGPHHSVPQFHGGSNELALADRSVLVLSRSFRCILGGDWHDSLEGKINGKHSASTRQSASKQKRKKAPGLKR